MDITYTVYSVVQEDVPMVVDINGNPTTVRVPGLTVELVSAEQGHTYRMVPPDMEAALALFTQGATINVNFSAA